MSSAKTTFSKEPRKPHKIWSPKETQALLDALEQRLPIAEISKTLGRSQKAIRRKCEEMGISSATAYKISKK